jgi:ribosome biogenesis GTPase
MVVNGPILYGWSTAVAERFIPFLQDRLVPARVTAVDRSECDAVTAAGPVRALTLGSHVCTGDWVTLDGEDDRTH